MKTLNLKSLTNALKVIPPPHTRGQHFAVDIAAREYEIELLNYGTSITPNRAYTRVELVAVEYRVQGKRVALEWEMAL